MSVKRLHCYENDGSVLLSEILDWCLKNYKADRILMAVRSAENNKQQRFFDPAVEHSAMSILGKHFISKLSAKAWPGTKLIGHTGWVYVARFDENLREKLIHTENNLFNWRHDSSKRLPEDLCLFRQDANYPILASITHENDAYVLTSSGSFPPGFIRTDYSVKEMLLAWEGPYLCL